MDVQLPDGRMLRGVPDGTTKAQLAQKLQTNGFQVPQEWLGTASQPAIHEDQSPTASVLSRAGAGIGGLGETALHLGTGAIAGLGGGLGFLGTLAASGGDVQGAKAVQEAIGDKLIYQPRGQSGQSMSGAIGDVMALPGRLGTKIADPAQEALTKIGAPPQIAGAVGAALATAPDAALQALGLRGGMAARSAISESNAARAAAATIPKQAANITQVARAAGLKLNPSDIPGARAGSLIEGASGSAKLKTRLSQENQPVITSHAREEIGLSPGPKLTPEELEAAKAPHNEKYQAVADKLQTVDPDPTFNKDLADAGEKWKAIIQLPGVAKLKKQFANLGTLPADQVMKQIAILRESGYNDLTSASIKTTPNRTSLKARGSAQVDIANAFEDLIARNAQARGFDNLVPELRDARVSLAKINSVKRALIGDDVSAASLAKQAKFGTPLSGRLKLIADVARAHPDVMRDISKVKNKSPIGVLDVAGPGSLAIATGQPLVAAGVFARPAGRSFVASDKYQNTLGPVAPAGQLPQAAPQYFKQPTPRRSFYTMQQSAQPTAQNASQAAIPSAIANSFPEAKIVPGTKPGWFAIQSSGEKPFMQVQGRAAAEKILNELPSNGSKSIAEYEAEHARKFADTLPSNVTPIKHQVTLDADPDSGQVIAKSTNGETIAQENGKYLQFKRNDTAVSARGKGEGVARYRQLAAEAEKRGLLPASDISLSPSEVRLWDSLKRSGWNIKTNAATINKNTGNLISVDPRVPVFEVVKSASKR